MGAAARALLPHPGLWSAALVQAVRLAPSGWWRRWPPLPRPDPDWMAFRLETQYGDERAVAEPGDIVAFLAWCRDTAGPHARQVHGRCRPVR
jgi:hypothetical protein